MVNGLKPAVCHAQHAQVTCPPKTSPDPMLLFRERIEDTGPKKGGVGRQMSSASFPR
jgi:hypothetical protein